MDKEEILGDLEASLEDRHISEQGVYCFFCKGQNLKNGYTNLSSVSSIEQEIYCNDCGRSFYQDFVLVAANIGSSDNWPSEMTQHMLDVAEATLSKVELDLLVGIYDNER
jgi:hypothetical protein